MTAVSSAFPPASREAHEASAEPTRIMLRPIATPLSLGFAALAVASFTVAALELRWIDPLTNSHTVGLTVLAFAVPLQLISAIYGFLARDAIAATGLGILGGTWLAVGTTMYVAPPGTRSGGLGVFLLGAATVLTVPALSGFSSKVVAAVVMLGVAVRFYLTGAYELTGSETWRVGCGICGLVVAGLALYAAFAYELEAAGQRTILPTGRVGRSKFEIDREPGVRQEL